MALLQPGPWAWQQLEAWVESRQQRREEALLVYPRAVARKKLPPVPSVSLPEAWPKLSQEWRVQAVRVAQEPEEWRPEEQQMAATGYLDLRE